MCISQNNSYKKHHTIDYLQKPVTYSKLLVHLSKVSIYVNEHISAIRMKCSSIIRICYFCVVPLFICFPIEGSWDAHLSYFREPVYNWLIYILFISESQDSLAQFMANLQKVEQKCVENMLDSLWQLDQPFCIKVTYPMN